VTTEHLIVIDARGEELWRVGFEAGLMPEHYANAKERHPKFVDLDDDGRLETLFVAWEPKFATRNALICFDAQGREIWRFVPDGEIRTAEGPFENIFRVNMFELVELAGGGTGVVTVSTHYLYCPTQIALLSALDGSLIAEYWHAGHIGHHADRLLAADYDGDGSSEAFATGISNSYRRATLVVLDLENMSGASVEEDHNYQFEGFGPPNEIARILFPRSSMSAHFDSYNIGEHVWLTPGFINVATNERLDEPMNPVLIFHLRPDWALDHVVASSTFEAVHDRLIQENVLSVAFEEELEALPPLKYVGTPQPLTVRR
jgi:hypothetical protein